MSKSIGQEKYQEICINDSRIKSFTVMEKYAPKCIKMWLYYLHITAKKAKFAEK